MEGNKKSFYMWIFLIVLYIVLIYIGCLIGNFKDPATIWVYTISTFPIFLIIAGAIIANIEMKEAKKRQKNIWGGLK